MNDMGPVERVEMIMGIIGRKWKPAIIYALVMEGPLRFVELKRRIPRKASRMISSAHQSPNTSSERAIGHSAFSKLVRFTMASSSIEPKTPRSHPCVVAL